MKFLLGLLLLSSQIAVAAIRMPFTLPQKYPSVGEYHSIDHPGAVFVIEAYFNGCHYCNDNAPKINQLAKKYMGNDKVQVLDVSVDRASGEYDSWIKRNKPNHPVLDDNKRLLLFGELGARGFPTTYVINSLGKVLYKHVGASSSLAELEAAIDAAINQLED